MGSVDGNGPPPAVLVDLCGPLTEARRRDLCQRVAALVPADTPRLIVCELRGVVDLSVIDALARLHLLAQRANGRLWLRCADENLRARLRELLALSGLDAVLGPPL